MMPEPERIEMAPKLDDKFEWVYSAKGRGTIHIRYKGHPATICGAKGVFDSVEPPKTAEHQCPECPRQYAKYLKWKKGA